jgi:hypothetical protein
MRTLMARPALATLASSLAVTFGCKTKNEAPDPCEKPPLHDAINLNVGPATIPVDGRAPCSNEVTYPTPVRLRVHSVDRLCYPASYPGMISCLTRAWALPLDREVCASVTGGVIPKHLLKIEKGMELIADHSIAVRDFEEDVSKVGVLKDPSGRLLVGVAHGTRPEVFEKAMFQGLELTLNRQPLCIDKRDGRQRLAVTFSTPDGACTLEDVSEATCTLWGRPYLVRLFAAWANPKIARFPIIDFMIADPDFIEEGHVP